MIHSRELTSSLVQEQKCARGTYYRIRPSLQGLRAEHTFFAALPVVLLLLLASGSRIVAERVFVIETIDWEGWF